MAKKARIERLIKGQEKRLEFEADDAQGTFDFVPDEDEVYNILKEER